MSDALLDEVTAEAGDPFAEALREAGLPNEPSSSVLLTQRVKEARALQALWEQLVETHRELDALGAPGNHHNTPGWRLRALRRGGA